MVSPSAFMGAVDRVADARAAVEELGADQLGVEDAGAPLWDADHPVAIGTQPRGHGGALEGENDVRVLPGEEGVEAHDVARADADEPVRGRRPELAVLRARAVRDQYSVALLNLADLNLALYSHMNSV